MQPPMDHKERECLRSHLENLCVGGDSSSGKRRKPHLYNWVETGGVDDEEDRDDSVLSEGFEYDAPVGELCHWPDPKLHSSPSNGHQNYVTRHQEEPGRYKVSYKGSRLMRQEAQGLSPLVLHAEDMSKFSQGKNFFTLEEPYDTEDHYIEEAFENRETNIPHPRPPRTKFHSTVSRASARTFKDRQIGDRSPLLASSVGSLLTRTPSLKPVTWGSDFLEYEVDAMEAPRKPGSHLLKDSKDQWRSQSLPQKDRVLHLDNTRKTAGIGVCVSRLQHSQNPESGPLPLLTELEDYIESDEEYSGTSIYGDIGGPSLKKHGDLDPKVPGRTAKMIEDEKLQLAVSECRELAICEYRPRSLSQKYRPRLFEEIVGQNIVMQALSNAILKAKIAPVYLFQGSRGTGKTSAARIFASALICMSPEAQRPCGTCRVCISVAMGKCSEVKEVDAASNNGIERVRALLDETLNAPPLLKFKVFIIDECHVLTSETWNALLKILEEPPSNVVFVLITTDPDQLPRTAVSRCQKFPFTKIRESEIVKRLEKLASMEGLNIDMETLQLIASKSDGSLRDAETTLDQLSLLGQAIDPSSVYELVGSAPDERMLSLLDSALVADTISTVRRVRELVELGVEPLSLMSRLATLITDILAGSYKFTDNQRKGFFKRKTLSEEKLERLRLAMKTLADAEKQLRVSNDRTTWLTAALLQLGPDRSFMFPVSCGGTSLTQSPVALDDGEAVEFEPNSSGRQTRDDEANFKQNGASNYFPPKSETSGPDHHPQSNHWSLKSDSPDILLAKQEENTTCDRQFMGGEVIQGHPHGAGKSQQSENPSTKNSNAVNVLSPEKLDEIWQKVIKACQPLPLRHMLFAHSKLASILMLEVEAIVNLEVFQPEHKSRFERSQKSIASVFELVLGFPVEVSISLTFFPEARQVGAQTWVLREKPSKSKTQNRVFNGYSSTSLNSHELTTNPRGLEHFQAIPAAPYGHDFRTSVQEKENPIGRMHSDGRHISQFSMPMLSRPIKARHLETIQNAMGYAYAADCDETFSDGEREIVEARSFSPECCESATQYYRQRRRNMMEATHIDVDHRRSCDTDLQKRKGSGLKMVRRLTARSRSQMLPNSDPNSPDNRGSSLRVPRFVMSRHNRSQDAKESNTLGDPIPTSEQSVEFLDTTKNAAASLKKNKLKGAAGSLARFFQGKLMKQASTDSSW